MPGGYKRKKYHFGDTHLKKGWKLKRRTKDLDEIDVDLMEGKVEKLLTQDIDFDKPGLAQFYCVHCSKHFIDNSAFQTHIKSKPHKRRLHALKTEPYSIEESERAAGLGSYIKPKKRKMETLLPNAVKDGETLADVKKRAKIDGVFAEKPEVDEKAGEHLEEDLDENGSGGSSEDEDEDKEGDVRM
ncbi:zinc finger protein 593 homolog [Eurytemora carolleeae]|uniref:zinc finger protein 593 homolog n=1 Tax=Eurytemora carolleeae TaxID=1294199 RepID=UPI000C761801|nr:zinc finger protein 593 homolog [Eurytemora carolleeae]|eukprot:XP_023341348.1 zinc finger protein 593 homolog [Eurytemora affinis]